MKKLSSIEKNNALLRLKNPEFFGKDKELLARVYPTCTLHNELARVNEFNRSSLCSKLLYVLLDYADEADIVRNRKGELEDAPRRCFESPGDAVAYAKRYLQLEADADLLLDAECTDRLMACADFADANDVCADFKEGLYAEECLFEDEDEAVDYLRSSMTVEEWDADLVDADMVKRLLVCTNYSEADGICEEFGVMLEELRNKPLFENEGAAELYVLRYLGLSPVYLLELDAETLTALMGCKDRAAADAVCAGYKERWDAEQVAKGAPSGEVVEAEEEEVDERPMPMPEQVVAPKAVVKKPVAKNVGTKKK